MSELDDFFASRRGVEPGAQVTPDAPSDLDTFFSERREQEAVQQQSQVRKAIEFATKDDPELAAERRRLSQSSGLPLRVVESNLEELRAKEKAKAYDLVNLAKTSPILYRQLTDPQFTAESVDDIFTLDNLERSVGNAARYVMGADGKGGLPSDAVDAGKTIGLGATVGVAKMFTDMAAVVNDVIGFESGAAGARRDSKALQSVMDRYGMQAESSTGQAVQSGLQSAGTNLALLPLGLVRGLYATANQAATTVAGLMSAGVGADAFNRAREQDRNKLEAGIYAIPEATFEFVFERIPAAKLFGDIAANTGLLKTLRTQALSEGWTEQVTTLAQDFNEWMNLNQDKTLAEFIAERPEAAYQTFIATLVGVGVQTTTSKGINKVIEKATDTRLNFELDALQQQMQLASQSLLRERSPEQFRNHIQQVVEANEAAKKEIYVDGEVLNQLPQELLEQLPESVRNAISDAVQTNSTVAIPMADVLTIAPGTELEQIINDNARMSPTAASRVESKTAAEMLAKDAERVLQQAADTQAWQQSSETVRGAVLEQLNATGRFSADVNDAYATLQMNFFSTMAARVGVTPSELYERYTLKVAAQGQGGNVLNADPATPEFREWFGESKAVDAQGAPLTLFRGMAGETLPEGGVTEMRPTTGLLGTGVYMTGFPGRAAGYTRGERGQTYPLYASIQNPISEDAFIERFGRTRRTPEENQAITDQLISEGYDGIIAERGPGQAWEVVAFRPEQVKSVFNERPTQAPGLLDQRGVQEKGKAVPTAVDEVSNVESAFEFAATESFPTNRDFKLSIQARVVAAAKAAKVKLDEFTVGTEEYLVRVALADGLTALRTNANAVGWYNEKVTKALRLVSLIHPEIATDPQAKFAFVWAMAVTSNGLKVDKNFELAEAAYQQYKVAGRMPTDIGIGTAAKAINKTLQLYNTLIDKHGFEVVERFMTTTQTVKEVEAFTGMKVSGENLTTQVYGAAALGPKIGNGFFMNLYGRFEQLTMDRWLMRTWGRWTGTLVETNPEQVKAKRTLLKGLIQSLTPADKKAFEAIIKRKLAVGDVDAVGQAIWKASQKPANREAMAVIGVADETVQARFTELLGEPKKGQARVSVGDELRKAGNALTKYLDGQKEAPSGPPERGNIRKVFGQVLAELQKTYPALTMSDLQALLWYPEKRLYDAAKTSDEATDGYEDDEAPDYANAAAKLARSQGIPDADIAAASAAVDAELQAAVGAAGVQRGERGPGDRTGSAGQDGVLNQSVAQTDTPAFQTWSGNAPVIELGDDHEFRSGESVVVEALHGTTNADLTEFLRERANVESDMGAGFYASNTPEDVATNYANVDGPDLTQRVELLAERLEDDFDGDMDAARDEARKRLSQGAPNTLKLYVSFKNPAVIGGQGETFLDYTEEYNEETDEYGEPTGALVDFVEALRGIASDFNVSDREIESAIDKMFEQAGGEGLKISDAHNIIKSELLDASDDEGNRASNEVFRQALSGAGFDGVIDTTVNDKFGPKVRRNGDVFDRAGGMKGMNEGTVHFIAFEPEQLKSATGNDGSFDADDRNILSQGPRGTFSPSQLLLTLNEGADLSTFLHESGHFFLEVMADLASQPNAPQQIQDDMATALKWFGVPDLATWNSYTLDQKRPYHERWAESFEQYLFEGKAPSVELQPLFRRFREFMVNVYKSLTKFMQGRNLKVSDDVRQVFGRMLAVDEQIAQTEEASGMLPDFEATNEAIEKLQARSLRDLKWTVNARNRYIKALQKEAKTLRKGIEEEVRAEVEQQPLYKAINWLKKGETTDPTTGDLVKAEKGFRLDTAALAEMYPESMLARPDLAGLKGMTAKGGLHPDMVADMFGFESGDALVRNILDAEPIASVIEGMTDQRMLERHGDLSSPEAIAQAADEAVHNEARAKSLATELKAQADMMNVREDTGRTASNGRPITVSTITNAAKQFAQNLAARRRIKDLKNAAWQHRSAEARAGKRWQEATTKGETEAAVQAKRDQLLNNAATKALQEAQVEARKILEFFKKVTKGSDEKTVERGRDPDVVNAMRAILAAYGVAPRLEKSALAYMEVVAKNDPAMYAALKPSVDGAMLNAKPLAEMTMEELRGLDAELRSMWVLAKRSRQMEVDGNLMDMEDAADELMARMNEIGVPDQIPGERGSITEAEERGIKLKFAKAILSRVEQWAERIDGKFGGPFLRLVFQPVKDAADRYRTDKVAYRKKFTELVKAIAPMLPPGPVAAPELGYTFGNSRDSGMAELMHAILHTGNDSNKRKLLLGRGWATENADGTLDTSRWDAFIDRMHSDGKLVKEHYDFAQGVWDLLEDSKPLAQETHRKVFGRYFAEITANEVVTPFGTYRGGYLPAQTDSRLVKDAKLRELAEGENESMAYAFPSAPSGFTQARVEYNKPLLLDLRALGQHMDKVLLFSHMQGAVTDVRRLLSRKDVSYALDRIDPGAYEGMLIPWLNRAAKQIVETPTVGDRKLSRFLSASRSRAGMALMFANLSNTFQQITGFSMAAVKVRPGLMLAATAAFTRDPKGMQTQVAASSEFMRDRMLNEVGALNDVVEQILVDPTLLEKGQAWTNRHAYFLQAAADNTMSPIIWTAAYNQASEQGLEHKEAVRFADGVIRQTQGTTLPEDISRFESGPAAARLFTQFIGYFNMMANTNATAVKQIVDEMGVRKGAGKLIYVALAGLLVPIWVAEAIAHAFRGGPEDEDDDGYLDDWLMAVFGLGTIRGLAAQIPFVGQAGQLVINRFNDNPADDKFSLSPAVSLIESAASAPASVYAAIVEDGKKQKAVRDVAALATMVTGLPIYGVARPLGYLSGVAAGEIEPTGAGDLARGVLTGTASPESKQR
jgi:hypothetical protein